jgi:hypothetical protein
MIFAVASLNQNGRYVARRVHEPWEMFVAKATVLLTGMTLATLFILGNG